VRFRAAGEWSIPGGIEQTSFHDCLYNTASPALCHRGVSVIVVQSAPSLLRTILTSVT